MKSFQFLFILILFLGIVSCEKDNSDNLYNSDVEIYIGLLKSNQYDSLMLPEFTYEDIPALLKYRNEKQIITNFPHNPISSLMYPDCKLGMYVLWTIESIRAVAIDSEFLIMRFPSQNPVLALRDAEELTTVDDDRSQEIAAKAYFVWWYNLRNMNPDTFMNYDPLQNTPYRWK